MSYLLLLSGWLREEEREKQTDLMVTMQTALFLCFPSAMIQTQTLHFFFPLFAFLLLSISSRADWRGTLCRNVAAETLFESGGKCWLVVESRRTLPVEGLWWGKKCISYYLFSATVEMSGVNRYCTAVIVRPCGPSPPVLGSISEVWLAAATGAEWSGAECSDTGVEITGSFHILFFHIESKRQRGKKTITIADNRTVLTGTCYT